MGENLSMATKAVHFPLISLPHARRSALRGVTLYELLTVVAVVSILAILFVLSSLHFIVNTKISRVKEEHRVLARALQNYQIDYNSYPNTLRGLRALTAPTTYLVHVPEDPFITDRQRSYLYIAKPREGIEWLIVSAGPDGDIDLREFLSPASESLTDGVSAAASGGGSGQIVPLSPEVFQQYIATKCYDPTNGTRSDGDLITLSLQ
ncbi:MAG: type II secretion system protein GspG [bacterium]